MGAPILQYEAAQTIYNYTALTDTGDHTVYNMTGVSLISKAVAPVCRPDGLIAGATITPDDASANNVIDISACTCYLAGVKTTVSANTLTLARPTVNPYCKYSVIITSGGAYSSIKGTEGSSFSATRGAAGGPPLVTAGAIEIGQVWYSSLTAGVVLTSEIKQVPGDSQERFDYPTFTVYTMRVTSGILGTAGVTFDAALPTIHTGSVPKSVYLYYATPSFSNIAVSKDFVRPADSKSVSSDEYYGVTRGKTTTSLGQGSFSCAVETLADPMLKKEGVNSLFKFFPDRDDTDRYVLAQGYLGVTETFEVDGQITVACTISAQYAGNRITG